MHIVRLRVPVLIMVLAATAIPIAFRPLQQGELQLLGTDPSDIAANIAGFVPVGIVLAAFGPVRAVAAAALLSLFAETSQFVMLYRVPSLTDVATNTLGAILGVIVAARCEIKPEFIATRRIGAGAAVLALLLILGVWTMSGNWPGDRGATTRGTGSLEAHWTFDESGGGAALDSSGHDLNGAYHGEPKRASGPMGGAAKFDGTADYIDFGHPAALRLTGSLTVSAWIKSSSFPRDDAAIVSSRSREVGLQLDTTIDTGPRTIGFKLTNSCGATMARYGKTPLALNTWYYVAGVYNAEARTIDVYLNGELDNGPLLGPVTFSQKSSRTNLYAARRSDSDPGEFSGEISDLRIYSLPLTKAEIAADMRGSVPPAAPHRAAGQDDRRASSPSEDHGDECSGTPDPGDEKIPGAAAALGVLAAIACAGLFPSSEPLRCLIASLAAGLLFLTVAVPTLPITTRCMILLLCLAGGASVAFTMRRQDGAARRD
jgi:Concanavalin A-like lectin/glucanases superfamily/VanZ like family